MKIVTALIRNCYFCMCEGLDLHTCSVSFSRSKVEDHFVSYFFRFGPHSLTLRVVAVDPNLPLSCRAHPCSCWLVLSARLASSPIAHSALRVIGRSGGAALHAAFGGGQRFALPWGAFGPPNGPSAPIGPKGPVGPRASLADSAFV